MTYSDYGTCAVLVCNNSRGDWLQSGPTDMLLVSSRQRQAIQVGQDQDQDLHEVSSRPSPGLEDNKTGARYTFSNVFCAFLGCLEGCCVYC